MKVGKITLTRGSCEHQHSVSLVIVSEDGSKVNIYALKDHLENVEFNESTSKYVAQLTNYIADKQFETALSSNSMTAQDETKFNDP